MLRVYAVLAVLLRCSDCVAQAPAKPLSFEMVSIRPRPFQSPNFARGGSLRGDRYTLTDTSLLDMIERAYSLDPATILGGPSSLDYNRFDIDAKAPANTSPNDLKLMLRTLLADRFKLTVHQDIKPLPAFVLRVAGAKPKLKPSTGESERDCEDQTPKPMTPGVIPNFVVTCHDISMAKFADLLPGWAGGYVPGPAVEATRLTGNYDLTLSWTARGLMAQAGPDGITIFDALERQLGLKLALETAPRPALAIDHVDEAPTPNAANIASLLPPLPSVAFDVAVIKPSRPEDRLDIRIDNGSVHLSGATLKFLIDFGWQLNELDTEALANAPRWLATDRFDLQAKVAPDASGKAPDTELDDLREPLKALLIERFKLQTHPEQRPVNSYELVAATPKLTKADPSTRTRCNEGPGPDGKDPRLATPILNRLVTCSNVTMAQFVEELQDFADGYIYRSVFDSTGLIGGWNLTLSFTSIGMVTGGGGGAKPIEGSASDPSGALTLPEALNRELGLRLKRQIRPGAVLVLDHVEEKPTEN